MGKTFVASEKVQQLNNKINIVICQKSKVEDWIEHFKSYYSNYVVVDLTIKSGFKELACSMSDGNYIVGVINYDLTFRRKELLQLKNFTLVLDESSLIQNPDAKRTKTIFKLNPENIVLLSGTICGGKYERLLTQMNLLGWKISEKTFWNQYVDWEWNETQDGFWQKKILGYKNEDRLKRKMRQHGCDFLKTDEVFDLPAQIDQSIFVNPSAEYLKFHKNRYIEFDGQEFMGDTVLTQMLHERQFCGHYNKEKIAAFGDILDSTEDRLIVFYNFTAELEALIYLCGEKNRPVSIVNGSTKELSSYDRNSDSVTFIQYQAGAMGLNMQLANKIIYFTPPLSSELFEQSKKRIHRIGQERPCFYYYLICRGSVEEHIYGTLALRRDYTEKLFEGDREK